MAYVKQTWATGDVITAEKLNHMEDGIGDGIKLIHIYATEQYDSGTEEYSYTIVDTDMTHEEYWNLDNHNNTVVILNLGDLEDGAFYAGRVLVLNKINSIFSTAYFEQVGNKNYISVFNVYFTPENEWTISRYEGEISIS